MVLETALIGLLSFLFTFLLVTTRERVRWEMEKYYAIKEWFRGGVWIHIVFPVIARKLADRGMFFIVVPAEKIPHPFQ